MYKMAIKNFFGWKIFEFNVRNINYDVINSQQFI